MADQQSTFRWIVGSLIAFLAASGSIAAVLISKHCDKPVNPTPDYGNTRPSVPDKANPNPTENSGSSRPPSPGKPNVNNDSPTPEKIDCRVEGAVYDFDKNSSPMPNVRVYLTDDKHPDVPLATTQPNGEFTGDCSQIPSDDFPKKVKIVTFAKLTLIEHELPVMRQGRKGLTLYVSESNIKIARNRTLILKQIQQMPEKVNPVINRRLANKE